MEYKISEELMTKLLETLDNHLFGGDYDEWNNEDVMECDAALSAIVEKAKNGTVEEQMANLITKKFLDDCAGAGIAGTACHIQYDIMKDQYILRISSPDGAQFLLVALADGGGELLRTKIEG